MLCVVTAHWVIDWSIVWLLFSKDSPSFKKRCRGRLKKSVAARANTILFPQTFCQKVGVLHLLQLSDRQTDKRLLTTVTTTTTTTQKPVNILWKSQRLPVSLKPWLWLIFFFFLTFMQLDSGVESVNLFWPHRLPLVCPPLFFYVPPPIWRCDLSHPLLTHVITDLGWFAPREMINGVMKEDRWRRINWCPLELRMTCGGQSGYTWWSTFPNISLSTLERCCLASKNNSVLEIRLFCRAFLRLDIFIFWKYYLNIFGNGRLYFP